ncbi:MAG: tRNA glutamyl-Q(34) synthetase GluQRS, partial [Bacteroidales bacterium]|nr:tRNA glutamyl-Q(34) synthetase GluQRS [Bacteroidales bacterium]
DFILRRADGAWAYQLAVVVDDALMGVTEVVRGRDLLLSVLQQLYLYEVLGYSAPRFAHLPLLCNEQGQRLCKRDKSLDMGVLRQQFSAEEIIGHIAHIAGLTDREEKVSANDLLPHFSWDKIPHEDVRIEN